MHPAQKRAIFAMLTSIEGQLQHMRSLLYLEEPGPIEHRASVPRETKPIPHSEPGFLTSEEEDHLEKLMETQRLEAMRQHEAQVQKYAAEVKDSDG